MPKVSIIMPVYNEEEHLSKALDSLVNQTIDDFEIIAVDDASTDNSLNILNEYASKYPFLRVYHNDKNLGQGATRNIGIELATGEYIGFMDADDCMQKIAYEVMYNEGVSNNASIVAVNLEITEGKAEDKLNPDVEYIHKGRLVSLVQNPQELYWNTPSCCNKIFKRDFLGSYRFLENCTWEDVAFTYSLLMRCDDYVFIPQKFFIYRRDIKEGVSAKGYKKDSPLDDIFKVADEIENQAKLIGREDIYKEVIPLLQEAVCFQRMEEINSWNEPDEFKNKVMVDFYNKVVEKYGDYHQFDDGLFSAKFDIFLVNDVSKMAEQVDFKKSKRR